MSGEELPAARAAQGHEVTSQGDLAVRPGAVVRQSLLSKGAVHVGRDARIEGAVRAEMGALLEDGAGVEGLLEVEGPLHWGRGASARSVEAKGPLMTNGQVVRAASVSAPQGIHPRASLDAQGKGARR